MKRIKSYKQCKTIHIKWAHFMFPFSGVHPHGCTLSWKKPLDDGGSPLTAYVIEKKDFDKDIWISCGNFHLISYL